MLIISLKMIGSPYIICSVEGSASLGIHNDFLGLVFNLGEIVHFYRSIYVCFRILFDICDIRHSHFLSKLSF